MANRGLDFEADLKRSMPKEVECVKLHTPAPPPSQMDAIIGFLRGHKADDWMVRTLEALKFTPPTPYDALVSAPTPTLERQIPREVWATLPDEARAVLEERTVTVQDIYGGQMGIRARRRLVLAFEAKSTKEKRLDFSMVKPHQEEGLRKAGTKGHIAGIIVELASMGELGGEVWFLPIENYLAFKRHAAGASIPVVEIRKLGIAIEPDPDRGVKNKYYKLGKFLRLFGADVEVEEEF